jgi:2,3-dihydro-2,3-dihydroxybenzoate dehydrogenase
MSSRGAQRPVSEPEPAGTYVVTGGASGIGRATALSLLGDGHRVAVADVTGPSLAAFRREVAPRFPDDALAIDTDVTDEEQVDAVFGRAVEAFGPIDGVVASAGIRMARTSLVDLSAATWDNVINVNLRGTFLVDRAAARHLRGRSGSIVNIASVSAKVARPGQAAYAVSKAAVVHLTHVLALEAAADGVRVNAVCPGTTATPMIELAQRQDSDDLLRERVHGSLAGWRPGIPLRRVATADEQADAIRFLLSDRARHVTGQVLYVDGGETVV